jgi:hypothetical protein
MSGVKRGTKIALLLVAGVCLSTTARAADFSLFAAGWDTDLLGEGFGGGGRLTFGSSNQLQVTATWFGTFDEEIFGTNVEFESFDLEIDAIPLDVGYAHSFGGGTGFYLGAGGTLFFLDSDAGDLDEEFGFFGQLGYQWSNLFIEVLYREVEGRFDELNTEEITTSERFVVDLSGPAVNVGWRF